MAVGVALGRHNGQPVAAQNIHGYVFERLAAADRLHEDVMTAIGGILNQQAEVSEENQPVISWPAGE